MFGDSDLIPGHNDFLLGELLRMQLVDGIQHHVGGDGRAGNGVNGGVCLLFIRFQDAQGGNLPINWSLNSASSAARP